MSRLTQIISLLDKELINIKKSKNNGKSLNLIKSKKELFQKNIEEFKQIFNLIKVTLTDEETNKYVDEYNKLKFKRDTAYAILDASPKLPPNFKFKEIARKALEQERANILKMDIKTILNILQPYDGNAEGLDAFIDSLQLAKDLIKPEHAPTLLKLAKTKLTGKARLGLNAEVNNLDALIADIRQRCKDITSPESIIAQMKALKIKPNESTKEYCDSVEKCCAKLKAIYVNQEIPPTVADKMAMKVGIDTLVSGISNPETKLILKAGTFSSLSQAITKVNENCLQETNRGAQVLSIFKPRGQMNRGYANRGNRGGHRQSYNRNSNQNYSNGNNNHGSFNNNSRSRNNFSQRSNNFRGRRGNPRHVYSIQSGQLQPDMQPTQQMYQGYLAMGPGTQQTQQMIYPQVVPQQQHFFGQVQRGQLPSSQ